MSTVDTRVFSVPEADELSRPIGVVVVGAGYWGLNLLRNLVESPRFRVCWLVDHARTAQAQQAALSIGVPVTSDLSQALTDADVEAAVVATPAGSHEHVAMAALHAGVHVLVEKPLTSNMESGRLLVKEADARGLVLMVDHTYCYSTPVATLRQLARSGELGDIEYFTATRANLGIVRSDVDVVWDLAPHDLSVLDALLPSTVRAVGIQAVGVTPAGHEGCHIAQLVIHLSNGGFASINVSWLAPEKIRRVVVGGTKLRAVWDDLDQRSRLRIFDVSSDHSDAHPKSKIGGDNAREPETLRVVVDAFAHAVRTGEPSMSDGRRALRILEMLECASESLRCGGIRIELADGDLE